MLMCLLIVSLLEVEIDRETSFITLLQTPHFFKSISILSIRINTCKQNATSVFINQMSMKTMGIHRAD